MVVFADACSGISPKAPFAPQMFGNAGREHMKLYGTTNVHFAKIAEKNHRHSANNPYSQFRDGQSHRCSSRRRIAAALASSSAAAAGRMWLRAACGCGLNRIATALASSSATAAGRVWLRTQSARVSGRMRNREEKESWYEWLT